MTIPAIDLGVQRNLTKAFIDSLPTTLVLTPRIRAATSTGGFTWQEQAPRPAQVFSIIEMSGSVSGSPQPQFTLDGVVRRVQFELLGEWDAAIARYDVFTHQGKSWEVVDLWYENGWERRALVASYG